MTLLFCAIFLGGMCAGALLGRWNRNRLRRELAAARWCIGHAGVNVCHGCPAETDDALCDTVPAVGDANMLGIRYVSMSCKIMEPQPWLTR